MQIGNNVADRVTGFLAAVEMMLLQPVDWVVAHFSQHDPDCHCAMIEVAPSLFHCPATSHRVSKLHGPKLLIVTTRNPVSRAWLHYLHLRRKNHTDVAMPEAIARHPEIIRASRYDTVIARWRVALAEPPVIILLLEELMVDPSAYAARRSAALDLPAFDRPKSLGRSNAGSEPPSFLLARLGRQTAAAIRSKEVME